MAHDWLAEDLPEEREELRDVVSDILSKYDREYWIQVDESGEYPQDFVDDLQQGGWLSMLIPTEYGGGGASIPDAALFLETMNRWGAPGTLIHAQMYTMGAILRHGSEEQKQKWLPQIADGLRLQSFGVTEPDAGTDTTRIRTFARREGDNYVINGGKIFTSRAKQSDLLLLIARTKKYEDVEKKTDGVSVFLVDMRDALAAGTLTIDPIKVMSGHHTNQLTFTDMVVPAENLIGEEHKGFKVTLSGMNAERILAASQYVGSGLWFIDRATEYAKERVVFGRPIGMNQGIQFPIAKAFAHLRAASALRWQAAEKFEAGSRSGTEANIAKLLAAEAQWEAANAAMDTFGGYGLASEYGVEQKFRAARGPLIAPISTNLILAGIAQRDLGMPRSY
ncbi:acyl-CoA dehydrogenase [Nocardioides sp. dk4132]|jgi:acyl-CoA dehydrogenase|uniref:acyl-CoA dehydrogenase family protein n=1 Tax=unclassified Nocardioides TaxID=2615069 RepID=UPI0012979296|nr:MULTISPECIES: acyl-CoA dehydrogenase family protein [unclassified Nocardioides]MQW77461.1 acyl-CoA dehydrogenase [Nocardioides sp. dk4132]QGA09264.1 acyl-CoA dehydrogenase [Nocardioides sp. dk884]